MKKILALVFSLIAATLYAQQENTMYFMDRISYTSTLNAAQTPSCKFYLGGLLIPVSGQLPPSLYLGLTTPFSWDKIIYPGTGEYKDSLITPLFSEKEFDKFVPKLLKQNSFITELELPLLNFGFAQKKNFWTFGITEKIRTSISFDKGLLILPVEGNYNNTEIALTGMAVNGASYLEYAAGFSREQNRHFRYGVKLKYLSGHYNIFTDNNKTRIYTDKDNAKVILESDVTVHVSAPLDSVSRDKEGKIESVAYGEEFDNIEANKIVSHIFNPGNHGIALDIGFVKEYNSSLSFYASATDIGFIKWNTDAHQYNFKGRQEFRGVRIDSLIFDGNFGGLDYITDSLQANLNADVAENMPYINWLPVKLYAGAEYKLRKWLSLGLLYRGEYFNKYMYNAYTASINLKYMRYSSTTISYTIKNKNFVNLGFGTSFRMGPYNTFIVTDNIGAAIWWWKSEQFSVRMGTSMVFGVKKKAKGPRSVPLLGTYNWN
jgi:hypothetical protein